MAFTQLSFPGFSGERSTGTALFIPGNWHWGASNPGCGGGFLLPSKQWSCISTKAPRSSMSLPHGAHTGDAHGSPGTPRSQRWAAAGPRCTKPGPQHVFPCLRSYSLYSTSTIKESNVRVKLSVVNAHQTQVRIISVPKSTCASSHAKNSLKKKNKKKLAETLV